MNNSPYWFPSKRYGWGWGLPTAWQGWAVLAIVLAAMSGAAIVFPPGERPLAFWALAAVVSAFLVGVCLVKGEPLRWRWGQ
ncbi:MAG: hypothetical protein ABW220_12055 [Burkholderiaceae bacterium]